MANFAAIGRFLVGTKSVKTAQYMTKAFKNETKVLNLFVKKEQDILKRLPFEKQINKINNITNLGSKKSKKLFKFLPKEAQENFDTLINAGKRLGYIKTDNSGNILSGSMERFLTVFDKNSYSKMLYLEQNFKNLENADFKKIFNIYKTPEIMAENKLNIQRWLKQKEELKSFAETLEKEGQKLADDAKKEITEVLGIEPNCRSKSFESIYDKISKEVLKGKEISDISQARIIIRDLIGTRFILDDVSPEAIQKIVDNICKGIESGRIKPYRISNYANGSKRYFSEEQIKQIQASAAKKGIEISRYEADQVSVSGYVTAQMNLTYSNGAAGEIQIRSNLMHKYAEPEHIVYDMRMGKNIGKNISELEKYLEPVEDAVFKLKRNGLDKLYDKYILDCYKYIRNYELAEIKPIFELPQMPNKLQNYKILNFDNLKKIEKEMKAIKNSYESVAKTA